MAGRTKNTTKADDELAALARALGHPARVKILRVLLARNTCIAGTLADAVALAPSTVSQHLKLLKLAGLVIGEIDGPRRCYCANRKQVARLLALLDQLGPLTAGPNTEACR